MNRHLKGDLQERLTISAELETGTLKQTHSQHFRSQAVPRGVNNKLAMIGELTRLLKRMAGVSDWLEVGFRLIVRGERVWKPLHPA